MAISAAVTDLAVPGASKVGIFEISFSGTDYLTNGVSVDAAIKAASGFSMIEDYCPMSLGPSLAAGISDFSWDKANLKVKLYTSGAVECANALNISTVKIYFYVKGR